MTVYFEYYNKRLLSFEFNQKVTKFKYLLFKCYILLLMDVDVLSCREGVYKIMFNKLNFSGVM